MDIPEQQVQEDLLVTPDGQVRVGQLEQLDCQALWVGPGSLDHLGCLVLLSVRLAVGVRRVCPERLGLVAGRAARDQLANWEPLAIKARQAPQELEVALVKVQQGLPALLV